ncbi:adenosylmethionine decarboxylase [Pseudonocardia pini]|uniref:adenosylmethionine decarboxylase n=1 Tax=Pseudonocardia pini TaxID=2758030 RepID=UPI0015F0F09F|nr:adenosylmethionine decarboxylase [Pseudonocardia pini]
MHAPTGRHVLAELRGVDAALLDDPAGLAHALRTSLIGAGADVRQVTVEPFTPQGATVVALLAESHASVHTWPERGIALADVFTCGDTADPVRAVRRLALTLGATDLHVQTVDRGGAGEVREPIAPGLTRHWTLDDVRVRTHTALQEVLVADTAQGVTLFCDTERQSAWVDSARSASGACGHTPARAGRPAGALVVDDTRARFLPDAHRAARGA